MSFDDDTLWRVNLNLDPCEPTALPITQITEQYVWTNDDTGKCRKIRLDREELVRNGWVCRGRMKYHFYYPHVYDDEYEACEP